MSQYEKASDEELAGLESRMRGGSYAPEIVELVASGYKIRYNTATQLGEMVSGAVTMPLVEHQVRELTNAPEGPAREQLAKAFLAGHQRTIEAMRARQQAARR